MSLTIRNLKFLALATAPPTGGALRSHIWAPVSQGAPGGAGYTPTDASFFPSCLPYPNPILRRGNACSRGAYSFIIMFLAGRLLDLSSPTGREPGTLLSESVRVLTADCQGSPSAGV